MLTPVKQLQPENAPLRKSVTLSGIEISERLLQFANTYSYIVFTPFGTEKLVKALQPENAREPISLTLEGMLTSCRLLQSEKAPYPMLFR